MTRPGPSLDELFADQCRAAFNGWPPERVIVDFDLALGGEVTLADLLDPSVGIIGPSNVVGTGPKGAIQPKDVFDAYRAAKGGTVPAPSPSGGGAAAPLAAVPPRAGVSRRAAEQPSAFTGRVITLDPWARNPLIDDARQSQPTWYAAAVAEGQPMPTLFKTGDLPPLTASGADPSMLLRLPWVARHAAAKADAQRFFEMVEDLSGSDGPDLAWVESGYIDEAANGDYHRRVDDWLNGVGLDPLNMSPQRQAALETAYDAAFPEEARERQEAEAAAAEKEAKARHQAELKAIRDNTIVFDAAKGWPPR